MIVLGVLCMLDTSAGERKNLIINLPRVFTKSTMTVTQAIKERRSVREYKNEFLTLQELSLLLLSAQGITDKERELRAAPSAGALYPLELYVVVGKVQDVSAGIYKYIVSQHQLIKKSDGDKRNELASAALAQSCIATAPASIVICGIYERTRRKYGDRAMRYVHMEVGAVAENVYLQGRTLQIGTVFVGAFDDNHVKTVVGVRSEESPLAILPLGKIPS